MTKTKLLLASLLLVFGLGVMAPAALAQGNGTLFNVTPSLYILRPNSVGDATGPVYMTMASGLGTIAGGEVFTITYSQPIVGASGIASLPEGTAAADFCNDSAAGLLAGVFCTSMSYSAKGNVLTLTNGTSPLPGLAVGNYITFWGVRIDTVGMVPGTFITATLGAVLNQNYPLSFGTPGVTISSSVNSGQVASTTLGGTVVAVSYPTAILTCFGSTGSDFYIVVTEQWAGGWTSKTDELTLAPYAPTASSEATNGSDISIALSGIPSGLTVVPYAPYDTVGSAVWGTFGPTTYTSAAANSSVTFDFPLTSTIRDEIENGIFEFEVYTTGAIQLQSMPMTASVTLNPMTPTSPVEYPAFTYPNGPLAEEPNYPLTAVDFFGCQTSLLFPYVTNYAGGSSAGALGNWDTAIEVANTSSDPWGSGTPYYDFLGAVPTAGSCTFYAYSSTTGTNPPTGDASPVATWTTPVVYTGGIDTFMLSTTAAKGLWGGYAIAICNFLNGVGYAEVVDNAGIGNWGVMGSYLAYVIPNPYFDPRWFDSYIGEFAITPYPYYFDDGFGSVSNFGQKTVNPAMKYRNPFKK